MYSCKMTNWRFCALENCHSLAHAHGVCTNKYTAPMRERECVWLVNVLKSCVRVRIIHFFFILLYNGFTVSTCMSSKIYNDSYGNFGYRILFFSVACLQYLSLYSDTRGQSDCLTALFSLSLSLFILLLSSVFFFRKKRDHNKKYLFNTETQIQI